MNTTLLVGGTVVQWSPSRALRTDIIFSGDRIGTWDASIPTTSTVDCTGCLVAPGFVVGHTHLYSGLATGMPSAGAPPTSFLEILQRVWWRLDQALDESTLRSAVRVAAMSAIRSGATCLIDHHESPRFIDGALDVIADELDNLGLRGVLTYGATDRHGEDGAKAGLAECVKFIQSNRRPNLRGAIGLHAPFTCSDETLSAAAAAAASSNAWLHYHAAEGPDDQAAAKTRWGQRLFHRLDAFGLLNERTIVAHAVDIDASEADLLRSKRAWVTHQARSNMNNGVGYAEHLNGLQRVAIGTDGIDNDLLAESSAAFFRRREQTGPAVWPNAGDLVSRGHRMAGEIFEEPHLGHLAPGAPADVVVFDYRGGTPITDDTLGGHLLFGLSSRYVRDVFVAGRPIMRNRKLVGIDEAKILEEAQSAAQALWARMESA